MHSYYLKGDRVGGSADCMIVNTRILGEFLRSHKGATAEDVWVWTQEEHAMKLLSDRLNSPTAAEWESYPGVIYLSDMAPYLIRVACCFEGEGTRYRVDPLKLWNTIGSVS